MGEGKEEEEDEGEEERRKGLEVIEVYSSSVESEGGEWGRRRGDYCKEEEEVGV